MFNLLASQWQTRKPELNIQLEWIDIYSKLYYLPYTLIRKNDGLYKKYRLQLLKGYWPGLQLVKSPMFNCKNTFKVSFQKDKIGIGLTSFPFFKPLFT